MAPFDTLAKVWEILGQGTAITDAATRVAVYKDALKRYKLDSRYADEVRGVDSITPKMLMMYFGILNEMSEKELLRDLELVYDNEKLRAKVYGFWRAFRTRVPKPVKKEVPFS